MMAMTTSSSTSVKPGRERISFDGGFMRVNLAYLQFNCNRQFPGRVDTLPSPLTMTCFPPAGSCWGERSPITLSTPTSQSGSIRPAWEHSFLPDTSQQHAIEKADVLLEALGWIRRFRDKVTV